MTPLWVHRDLQPAAHRALLGFLCDRIWGDGRSLEADNIMGVLDGAEVAAAVAFHNYHPEDGVIEISAASDSKRWLTRQVLKALFEYPFEQLGCGVVVARMDPDNKPLNRIFTAYGFSRHVIPNLRGKGRDEAVCVLTDDAWRANGFHKR